VRGAIKGLFILASAVVPGALPGERR
jgi:hypothetical protein